MKNNWTTILVIVTLLSFPLLVIAQEDCISFNPNTIQVKQINGRWKIVDGNHWMFDFGNKRREAYQAYKIIKHYRMNQSCFVGRPDPSFQYLLVSGQAPTGSFPGEDCVSFNPNTIQIKQIKGRWKIVDGSHWMFDFGNKRREAYQAFRIIKKYGFNRSCFVGRPQPSFTYMTKVGSSRPNRPIKNFKPIKPKTSFNIIERIKTPQTISVKEDCVSFNPRTIMVRRINGRWKIVDGNHLMFDFGNKKREAYQAYKIIKHYRMNQSCFVGRPDPSFQYLLVSGQAPTGSFSGEDCIKFNPDTIKVKQINGRWKIVDGNHWMFDFGNKRREAYQAYRIIKKYGFTYSCFVGRPHASFQYLRK